jgi:hypothetical protein
VNSVLLTAGVAAIILAVVGGGAQAFGIKVPVLDSLYRQAALGLAGAAFIAIAVATGQRDGGGSEIHRHGRQIQASLVQDIRQAVDNVLGTGVSLATGTVGGNRIFNTALSSWESRKAKIATQLETYFSDAGLDGKPMPSAWSAFSQAVENLYYLSGTEIAAAYPSRCDRTKQFMTYIRGSAMNLMCPNSTWSPDRWGIECNMAKTSWNAVAICDENSVSHREHYRRGPPSLRRIRSRSTSSKPVKVICLRS